MSDDKPRNFFRAGRCGYIFESWEIGATLGIRWDLQEGRHYAAPAVFGLWFLIERPRWFCRFNGALYLRLWPIGGGIRVRAWFRPSLIRWRRA